VNAYAAPDGLCLPRQITEHESGHDGRGRLRQQLGEIDHHLRQYGKRNRENLDVPALPASTH